MTRAQLGNELGGVLCGVDGEGFRDREERGSEGGDGELLTGALVGMLELICGEMVSTVKS